MQKVDLNKEAYSKREYTNTIDTEFSQLVSPLLDNLDVEEPTVEEFFLNYETLFFEIPKTGENSHETLITRSSEYIGFQPLQDEIQALTEEITSLRQQLLEARQQLAETAASLPQELGADFNLPEISLPEISNPTPPPPPPQPTRRRTPTAPSTFVPSTTAPGGRPPSDSSSTGLDRIDFI